MACPVHTRAPHPAAQPRRAFVTQPCHSDAPGMLCVHQACTGGGLVLRESSAAFYSVLRPTSFRTS